MKCEDAIAHGAGGTSGLDQEQRRLQARGAPLPSPHAGNAAVPRSAQAERGTRYSGLVTVKGLIGRGVPVSWLRGLNMLLCVRELLTLEPLLGLTLESGPFWEAGAVKLPLLLGPLELMSAPPGAGMVELASPIALVSP